MALTITQQPDSLLPTMVRNPIEIAFETDNYIVFVPGREKRLHIEFNYLVLYEVGTTFDMKIGDNTITYSVVNTITAINQVLPRSNYPAYSAGDILYGYHLLDRFNSNPAITDHFTVINVDLLAIVTTLATELHLFFVSTIHENIDLICSNLTGGSSTSYRHYITQEGIEDEYKTRPTELKLGLYLSVAGDPVEDDTFTIQLENENYLFTFKTTPNNSGYQLPLRGALTLTEYQNLLLLKLNSAPCFLDKWTVTTVIYLTHIHFIFTSIGYKSGAIIGTSTPARYVYVNLPGYQEIYQPNFTSNIHLLCEKNYLDNDFEKLLELYSFPINETDGGDAHYISRFKIDRILYDFMNKTYKENLAKALPYTTNFPNANHLLKQFKFKYFESYGNPATNQLIQESEKYIAALYGAGHLDFITRKQLYAFGLLHNSGSNNNPISIKQYVDKDQPCYLYFYIQPSDGNDIGGLTRIYIIIYYDDGTTHTADIASPSIFNVPTNNCKAFFVPTGYNQRGVGNGNTGTKNAYMWEIVIEIDEDDIRLIKRYVLDCCSAYKSYIMYQNSRGGYDTVTITAPKEFSLELTEGKEVERILPTDYVAHDSQFEATIPKVRQNIKANIGYKKASDFDVLKELLMSKYVFVLPKNTTDVFIPVNIDRKSVQLESEDDYEKTFSLEFSPAHEFKNFEGNLWLK